jgi:hypothetical protein
MHYEVIEDPELEFNNRLRMEIGWGDVAKGLTQILLGYSVLICGTLTGVGLVVLAMFNGLVSSKPSNACFWQLYLGLGILSIIGLISYSIILGGKFKCLLHAAERHGARWFMFLCIACLFLGPAFQMASGIASWQAISELKKNPGKYHEFHLNPLGHWLHLVGFVISMLYPLCFTLFMRQIAVCLRASKQVMIVDGYLVLAAVTAAGTAFVLFRHPLGVAPIPPIEIMVLAGGWFVVVVGYFTMILLTRICIGAVMSTVKSPLEM